MTTSHDISHTSGLVAGPKPSISGASARKLSVLDRFGTPLWIAVGLSIIGLAILAALG